MPDGRGAGPRPSGRVRGALGGDCEGEGVARGAAVRGVSWRRGLSLHRKPERSEKVGRNNLKLILIVNIFIKS